MAENYELYFDLTDVTLDNIEVNVLRSLEIQILLQHGANEIQLVITPEQAEELSRELSRALREVG